MYRYRERERERAQKGEEMEEGGCEEREVRCGRESNIEKGLVFFKGFLSSKKKSLKVVAPQHGFVTLLEVQPAGLATSVTGRSAFSPEQPGDISGIPSRDNAGP
ncbi:hypothetical protein SAY87_007104 [Trapa incisa]|uniref:Uncharacterized protein n=1 Tax=Trapa incisa TaxID=236973 RepID=A0AAN7PZN3_9MYRT|nr:hypothetical protein SAY87_007104 [Trapa incisa]